MKTKNNAVLNSAAGYPKHRMTTTGASRPEMRRTEFRWLPGIDGDGGRIQPRGAFSDGAV